MNQTIKKQNHSASNTTIRKSRTTDNPGEQAGDKILYREDNYVEEHY